MLLHFCAVCVDAEQEKRRTVSDANSNFGLFIIEDILCSLLIHIRTIFCFLNTQTYLVLYFIQLNVNVWCEHIE